MITITKQQLNKTALRVYVVGGGFPYMKMFFDAGMKGSRSVEDADLVCFTGGEDVHPSFYNEEFVPGTYSNLDRDKEEALIYGECLALQKPMVGICRGGQFLNVMNGGSLWQDVDKHGGINHSVCDIRTMKWFQDMTSTHHQQMRPTDEAEVIAMARLSTRKKSFHSELDRQTPELDDVEVVWYPDSLSLCFQPHPEFQPGPCRDYFLSLVDDYVTPAC